MIAYFPNLFYHDGKDASVAGGGLTVIRSRLLCFIEIAVQRVFGDAKDLADLGPGLGDQERAGIVQEPDCSDLFRLVHECRGLSDHTDGLVDQRVQKIGNIGRDRLRFFGSACSPATVKVMSLLIARTPIAFPFSSRRKIVLDFRIFPSLVLVR